MRHTGLMRPDEHRQHLLYEQRIAVYVERARVD